ncbi:hypothetical protein [Chlamydiifrater phoenicopteri]|uniref:hypothetical protein n=1 Tax=Chlamydiifrater phoenicopteri TaxID=2681469 RepID=UPI001BCC67E5|nr:hypothetical protein [Chlamydiifrater phoenicopteri]
MGEPFNLLCQMAFRQTFNKQRFNLIFSGLCGFGMLFTLFLKVGAEFSTDVSVFMWSSGAFFLAFTVLFVIGVIVHQLLKNENVEEDQLPTVLSAVRAGWKGIWLSLLLSMPFFVAVVALVTAVMLTLVLCSLPVVGKVFSVILAFVPYVSALMCTLLFVGAFSALFFCLPILSFSDGFDYTKIVSGFRGYIARQLGAFFIALAPIVVSGFLVVNSYLLSKNIFIFAEVDSWTFLLQTLVLVVPTALILTPSLAFFFSFSFAYYVDAEKRNSLSM